VLPLNVNASVPHGGEVGVYRGTDELVAELRVLNPAALAIIAPQRRRGGTLLLWSSACSRTHPTTAYPRWIAPSIYPDLINGTDTHVREWDHLSQDHKEIR
jgi:hypothetical protein